jgi:hypothetical protein
MASVTGIMNEIAGDCGKGIKVSVKLKGEQRWIYCNKKNEIFWVENGTDLAAKRRDRAKY